MTESFDEKLEALHEIKYFDRRENIWREGSPEFNHKLCIAEDLLQVSWCSKNSDHNLKAAETKLKLIINLRSAFEELFTHINSLKTENKKLFLELYSQYSRSVMEKFFAVADAFKFDNGSGAYQLLANCLCPTKIDSLGKCTEMLYHKLLQLSTLYGLKMNEFKFGQEDKVDSEKAHPDFLKVVALIRIFHSLLLRIINLSENHATKLDQLVTYGLLTEKNCVRVIGIKVLTPITSNNKKRFNYGLFNVGVFPLQPSNEYEKQQLDLLISFLLEASRETIFEEKELITRILQGSNGKARMRSSMNASSTFNEGDKLVFKWTKSIGTQLSTTITLDYYLSEISTGEDKSTQPKEIYYGSIEHSNQPVFVKIFKCNKNDNFAIGNLFLRYNDVSLNNNKCEEYMEVSIAGKELNTFKTRSRQKKIQIITQLLLEMDHIHAQKIIHNDIKPSNIILLKQKHITPVDALPKQDEASILYCKFIDFELAKEFKTENGDTCTNKRSQLLESTAGTLTYNAPEKLSEMNNYIHPKTDIYSLGLIFIELIIEGEVDKEHLAINENNLWKTIEIKCNQIHPMKGQKIYGMLQKMVQYERQQRITARECLQMLDITAQVDVQDHTFYFFPFNTSCTESKIRDDKKAETHSNEDEKKRKRLMYESKAKKQKKNK